MTRKEFLNAVAQYMSDYVVEKQENALAFGRDDVDDDTLYEGFIESLNDAIMEGLDDGMRRWRDQKPMTEQDIRDELADAELLRRKECY